MEKQFHYLVRGIIRNEDYVLLAHAKGADNTFLPGGHVELGEKAVDALSREIFEEINMTPEIGRFIGAVEAFWLDGDSRNYEINLIFDVMVEGLSRSHAPCSCESHLEFLWVHVDDLHKHNLLPEPMIECIQTSGNGAPYWNSTL